MAHLPVAGNQEYLTDWGVRMRFENTGIPPKEFIDLCYPLWARIYIEVAHLRGRNKVGWSDPDIHRNFVVLTGFDPWKVQYAGESEQRAALYMVHEADDALFVADEDRQLDRKSALDFAHGWMAAVTLLSVSKIDDVDMAAERAAMSYGSGRDSFVKGFIARSKIAEDQA